MKYQEDLSGLDLRCLHPDQCPNLGVAQTAEDIEFERCIQLAELVDGDVDPGDEEFPSPSVVIGKYRIVLFMHTNYWDIWYAAAEIWDVPVKKMLTTEEVVEWIRNKEIK